MAFDQPRLDLVMHEKILLLLIKLTELSTLHKDSFVDNLTKDFLPRVLQTVNTKHREPDLIKIQNYSKLVFMFMLEGVQEHTIDDLLLDEQTAISVLVGVRHMLLGFPLIKQYYSLRQVFFKILVDLIRKCTPAMRTSSLLLQHEFVSTILKILQEEDILCIYPYFHSTQGLHTFQHCRDSLTGLLKQFFRNLDEKAKKNLAFHDHYGLVINSLFEASLIKEKTIQETLLGILFEIIMAELKSCSFQSIDEVYNWFMDRISKMYTSRSLSVDRQYRLNLKISMQNMLERYKNINEECLKKANIAKLEMMFKHIDILLECIIDSVIIYNQYREIDGDSMETGPYYFAHVTAEFAVYQTLRRVEQEAKKANLVELTQFPYWFNEYKHILQELYALFIKKNELVSAGFTLQELETLIPWSSGEMELEFRDFKMLVGLWWKNELERDETLKTTLAKTNRKVEAFVKQHASLEVKEWTKLDLTWSEFKEVLQKLAITKFEEAAGFECSQILMDNLIHRYRTVDINFKKLALVLHNLADIFDAQADFKQKMFSLSVEQRLKLENARRDIMEPEYFKIEFVNASTPFKFLNGQKYIYREKAMKKADDLSQKLANWFPDSDVILSKQVLRKSHNTYSDSSKMVIFIQKVNPVMTHMEGYEKLDIQHQIIKYQMKNATKAFAFKEQIDKVGTVRVSLSICEFKLPGILSWARVLLDNLEIEAKPVVSYLTNIQYKNLELKGYLESLQADKSSVTMTELSMSMQGVILAAVNGGIAELQSKFINKDYIAKYPEDKLYIDLITNEIKKQNIYLEGLLKIHGQMNKEMFELQREMEKEFAKRKHEVASLYGTEVDKTFKLPMLDKETLEQTSAEVKEKYLRFHTENS